MVIKGLNCLGLSGTSTFGGVELALIKTDGLDINERKKAYAVPYPDMMKDHIKAVYGLQRNTPENEEKLKKSMKKFQISTFNLSTNLKTNMKMK